MQKDVASQFVVAYYTTLVYHPQGAHVVRFYDERAAVYRPGIGNFTAGSVEPNQLSAQLEQGEKIAITSYVVLPVYDLLTITVNGVITDTNNQMVRYFNQHFTLKNVWGRWFILTDSFTNAVPPAAEAAQPEPEQIPAVVPAPQEPVPEVQPPKPKAQKQYKNADFKPFRKPRGKNSR